MKIISDRNIRYSVKHNTFNVKDNITNKIKDDKELFYAFQANIAMQFQDHYKYYKNFHRKSYLNSGDLHRISNDAAKAFLNIWIHLHNNDM